MKIILASGSPRRRELLAQMGFTFEVIPSRGEEIVTKQDPAEAVMELAGQKAGEIARQTGDDTLIIGADTVVVMDGKILGKPKDEEDAVHMTAMLQGASHQVYTGVCLIRKAAGKETVHSFYEATEVEFYPMAEEEIRCYVAAEEPKDGEWERPFYVWQDKAGGYGIQDIRSAKYIKGIRGDYYNVVGLPVARLYHELAALNNGNCLPHK